MSDLRDWAKLDTRWYDDPDLLACADEAEVCFRMWPVLVAKAKADSHAKANPDGAITIAPRRLATDARCDVAELGPALDAMACEGLLAYTAEGTKKLTITLGGFAKWQSPRGSAADRKARSREAKKAAMSRESHTVSHAVTNGPIDVDLDVDLDVEETPPPSVKSAPPENGGGGSADAVLAPTRPEQFVAEIQRCKRDLGSLSIDAQSAEAAMRADRGIDLEPTFLLMELYRPAVLMLHEFGREPLREAFASIVKRPDVQKPEAWMRKVATGAAERGAKPAKPAETFQERKAREDKAAMLKSLGTSRLATPDEWSA